MNSAMGKKSLIALCAESNAGKTSTLHQLIIRLCGGGSLITNISNAYYPLFHKSSSQGKHYYKDVNMILSYKNSNIYISTGGDIWAKIRGNFQFMSSINQPSNTYVFHNGTFKTFDRLTRQEQNLYRVCNVFVTAVSLSPYGAFEAAKHFTTETVFYSEAWIRKEKAKQSNYIDPYQCIQASDDNFAQEIIKVIDRIIAGNII